MPNPGDPERSAKNNLQRNAALWLRARSTTNVSSWYEWWSSGISRVGSTVVSVGSTIGSLVVSSGKHALLHTTAKLFIAGVAWFVGSPVWIAGIVAWGVGEGLATRLGEKGMEALADYGGGVAEDWIKFGAEEGTGIGVTTVVRRLSSGTQPQSTPTEQQQQDIRKDTEDLCATIGALAVLMQEMDKQAAKPLRYCDDVDLLARLQARIEAEMASVQSKVSTLELRLQSIQTFVRGRSTAVTLMRGQVETAVKNMVKEGSTWHWNQDLTSYGSRLYRCSPQHCFGPGTGSPNPDST